MWIDGLLFKLFIELEAGGRMWLTIKDLYTDVKVQVLYSGLLSGQFKVSQGSGQGRIRIFSLFADDISLLTTQQLFLAVLMHI